MTCSTSAVAVCCCSDFAQLVEQAGVLDGDDGLVGEILDQLDLLVGEGTDLLPVNRERPDQVVFLEHRHDEKRPNATKLDAGDNLWFALGVPWVCREVGDMDYLLGPHHAAKGGCRTLQGYAPTMLK